MGKVAGVVTIGRYTLSPPIASGGMASVCLALQTGGGGFSRIVAVKRLLPRLAEDPRFIAMFLDEARLAARVRHPNVAETFDVLTEGDEIAIVLEYVEGDALSALAKSAAAQGERIPVDVAATIVAAACRGLHAAHEARGPDGKPLGIVHRDVSPHNILVGVDGVPRVADFGIARADVRFTKTLAGELKGKPAYMAPEQFKGAEVARTIDVYSAGVTLWELCAGRRPFEAKNQQALLLKVVTERMPDLSEVAPWVDPALVEVVRRATAANPADRYATGGELAEAIGAVVPRASEDRIGALVERLAADELVRRRAIARGLEDPASLREPREPSVDLAPPVSAVGPAPEPGSATESFATSDRGKPLVGASSELELKTHVMPAVRPSVRPLPSQPAASAPPEPEPGTTTTTLTKSAFAASVPMGPLGARTVRLDAVAPPRPAIASSPPSGEPLPSGPRRRWRFGLAAVPLALLGAWLGLRGSPEQTPASARGSIAGAPAVQRVPSRAETTASVGASASASADLAPAGSSSAPTIELAPVEAKADASSRSHATPPTPTSPSRNLARTPAAIPQARPGCNPPTYVDADGIRRIKQHCF